MYGKTNVNVFAIFSRYSNNFTLHTFKFEHAINNYFVRLHTIIYKGQLSSKEISMIYNWEMPQKQ